MKRMNQDLKTCRGKLSIKTTSLMLLLIVSASACSANAKNTVPAAVPQPTVPDAVAQPVPQAMPVAVAQPAQPAMPVAIAQPAMPVAVAQPAFPVAVAQPAQPVAVAQPNQFVTPFVFAPPPPARPARPQQCVQGSAEQCNGRDDNCNGVIDEGCQCIQGSAEQCNGFDDNCNGFVDEGCAVSPPVVIAPPVVVVPPPPRVIPSQPGVPAGFWDVLRAPDGRCEQGAREVCNRRDDNCNGVLDEGCIDIAPVAAPPVDFLQYDMGVSGQFRPGTRETCNGLDDNGNGTIDENCLPRQYDVNVVEIADFSLELNKKFNTVDVVSALRLQEASVPMQLMNFEMRYSSEDGVSRRDRRADGNEQDSSVVLAVDGVEIPATAQALDRRSGRDDNRRGGEGMALRFRNLGIELQSDTAVDLRIRGKGRLLSARAQIRTIREQIQHSGIRMNPTRSFDQGFRPGRGQGNSGSQGAVEMDLLTESGLQQDGSLGVYSGLKLNFIQIEAEGQGPVTMDLVINESEVVRSGAPMMGPTLSTGFNIGRFLGTDIRSLKLRITQAGNGQQSVSIRSVTPYLNQQ